MKNLIAPLALAASLALPASAGEKAKDYAQTAFVTVSAQSDIPAAPRKVWDKVTTKAGLAKMLALEEVMGDENMGDAGSALCAKLGGEGGNLVVTHVKLENEIRYAWEPDHGGYVCHITVKFAPSGKGTKVTVIDSYSDEKPALIGKNAQDSKAHLAKSLEALKQAVL